MKIVRDGNEWRRVGVIEFDHTKLVTAFPTLVLPHDAGIDLHVGSNRPNAAIAEASRGVGLSENSQVGERIGDSARTVQGNKVVMDIACAGDGAGVVADAERHGSGKGNIAVERGPGSQNKAVRIGMVRIEAVGNGGAAGVGDRAGDGEATAHTALDEQVTASGDVPGESLSGVIGDTKVQSAVVGDVSGDGSSSAAIPNLEGA